MKSLSTDHGFNGTDHVRGTTEPAPWPAAPKAALAASGCPWPAVDANGLQGMHERFLFACFHLFLSILDLGLT